MAPIAHVGTTVARFGGMLGLLVLVLAQPASGCDPASIDCPLPELRDALLAAPENKDALFDDRRMYYVDVSDGKVTVSTADPDSGRHCPDGEGTKLLESRDFEMKTKGNFTAGTPKASWRIKLEGEERLFGMKSITLNSMWNDVSQMREALAWDLFAKAGVPGPDMSYAKLCKDGKYFGLYALIEQPDKEFIKDTFGKSSKGNLYRANWSDIGPADLRYRGDDGGDYFRSSDLGKRTYELATNEDEADANTYDDLATLVKAINGVGLEGGDEKFNTPEYAASIEKVFDVKTFLRWAAVNQLLGAWDNYWKTPSNYSLYNSGKPGDEKGFMKDPYFHFVPWDYDHSFGIDYFGGGWQSKDILDWEASAGGSKLPLIQNLLKNDAYRAYYLDAMEDTLDTTFNERAIGKRMGEIWENVDGAAYLESDSASGGAHTGRRWTNDQLYWNGRESHELRAGDMRIEGILHYVKMRHDDARRQIEAARR